MDEGWCDVFAELLEKLARREDLTIVEAEGAMRAVMDGRASDVQMAGLLVGLAMKGERPHEIAGFAGAMRAAAVKLPRAWPRAVDVCGTGGDRAHTFNISSVVAIVVAGCGVPVAKHGNRAVSSDSGSADVFEALGIATNASPSAVDRCLAETRLAFLFAPTFHPSMRRAATVRRQLGVRTAFNLLGPLTNPAGPRRQVVGVPRADLTDVLARVLLLLGSEHAWVVHGADGLDELSTTGYSKVSECRDGIVRTFYLHPRDVGLRVATREALRGGDAVANARIARDVLGGAKGAARDVVLLNAGAALLVAGACSSVKDGIDRAASAIDSGEATNALVRTAELCRHAGSAA
ncbi:MAG: anthranilate phosphoribosyltransferase [Bacteroidales bacterium]